MEGRMGWREGSEGGREVRSEGVKEGRREGRRREGGRREGKKGKRPTHLVSNSWSSQLIVTLKIKWKELE
jgi:hypothetical protein